MRRIFSMRPGLRPLSLAIVFVAIVHHGLAQNPTLLPASLSFGSEVLNTTSAAKTVTLTNPQTVPVVISNVAVSGGYAQTNNCGAKVAPGASCTFNVTFTPTATGTQPGTLTVTLSGTGIALTSITVTPANSSVPKSTSQQFVATGNYSDGSTQNITSLVTWGSSSSAVASITTAGLANALSQGTTTVSATSGSITGSTGLTVGPPALVSIALTPSSPTVAVGSTQQFTATGTFTDGSTQNISTTVNWSSAAPQVSTINSSGLATTLATGITNIGASSGSVSSSTVLSVSVAGNQLASDNFQRSNAASPNLLGPNWTLMSPDGADGDHGGNSFTISSPGQIQSTAATCCAKAMYYGDINWPADQYAQIQLLAVGFPGEGGPTVRMSSNGNHYTCNVQSLGVGNASAHILADLGRHNYNQIASSSTLTISLNDVIRCQAQGTTISMIDVTTSTTLLSVTDTTYATGYPGIQLNRGNSTWIFGSFAAGGFTQPLQYQVVASDNFQRANSPNLGSNWSLTGDGHCALQILTDQVEPGTTPAGCQTPDKEHYTGASFNNDQWSEAQVVATGTSQAAPDDNGAELRFNGTDNHYLCNALVTGVPGTAWVRLVRVDSGIPTLLVQDRTTVGISPNDLLIGQIQGTLLSCIDATTGTLLLTTFDSTYSSGVPGWTLTPTANTPIMKNWSGGNLH
jgi:hypothetical protein